MIVAMVCVSVMLPKQVDTIIISVRCSYDCMHMKIRRLFVRQEKSGMVIKLDKNYRALNAIVKRMGFVLTADPAKMRLR